MMLAELKKEAAQMMGGSSELKVGGRFWWDFFVGVFDGRFCGRFWWEVMWEVLVGGFCRRFLWEVFVGGFGGRF